MQEREEPDTDDWRVRMSEENERLVAAMTEEEREQEEETDQGEIRKEYWGCSEEGTDGSEGSWKAGRDCGLVGR